MKYDVYQNNGLVAYEVEADSPEDALGVVERNRGYALDGIVEIKTSATARVIEFDKNSHAKEYLENTPNMSCYLFVDFGSLRFVVLQRADAILILSEDEEESNAPQRPHVQAWVDGNGDFVIGATIQTYGGQAGEDG